MEHAAIDGWTRGRGWGWRWGADDQVGALNAQNPQSVLAALASIRQGRIIDLGVTIDRSSFQWPGHVATEVVAYRSPAGLRLDARANASDDELSFRTSLVQLSDHAGTQLDGLCHATYGADDHWYNGFTVADHMGDFGPRRAGAENIPPIIVSAVLADVPGYLGVDELEPHFAIGADLLEATLRSQGTPIRPGEAIMVRSGVMQHWGLDGAAHEDLAKADTSGITLGTARWLIEDQGVILVASDTSTVEVSPPVDGTCTQPVHPYALVEQGVHLGELHNFEELAAEQIYRFCYIVLAPKVRGTTAGFALRPVALI